MTTVNFNAVIGATTRGFQRAISEVNRSIQRTATGATVNIGANTAGFNAHAAQVQATTNGIARSNPTVSVNANTRRFTRAIVRAQATVTAFAAQRVVVPIRTAWNNYQQTMGQIANFSRNIGEVAGIVGRGGLMVIAPAAVPVIATAVGLIGNLGPMLGTVGGSAFALATAFGAAGLGAAGFASVAIPSISGVIKKSGELKEIDEKLANATTWKQRAKLLKEQESIYAGMSNAQAAAGKALNSFQASYSKLVKDMETPVLNVFASALKGVNTVLQMARPMIESSTQAVQNLMNAFNQNLKTADVKSFFTFMKDYAGPALETVGKAVGNFIMGLGNMMAAFGPLSTETQNSFLKMSESFRNWSANLGKNEKFQKFVSYVSENMPKIRSIFGDAIKGIINTFAGFAPTSADMMTNLQKMMDKFKQWSSSLAENKGFQNFLNYIRDNGPTVVSTIGSIVKFITNLGIAMAPIGSKMLELVGSFTGWANKMMEAHPWLGKIAAAALVIGGGLTALAPPILLMNKLFGNLGLTVLKAAGKMAASWVIAMGPVGWVIAAVVALAVLVIANWDKISAWTKKAWGIVSEWISQKWSEIKAKTSEAASNMWQTVSQKFSDIVNSVKEKMAQAKSWVQNKWEEAKSAASQKLAEIVVAAIKFFSQVVTKTREKLAEAVRVVGEKIGEMPGKVKSYVSKMVQAGADLVGGVIEGIKSKISEGLGVIGGLATSLIDRFKRDTDTHSPSRAFANVSRWFVPGIVRGIDQTSHLAYKSVASVAGNILNELQRSMKTMSFADVGANAPGGIAEGVSEKSQPLKADIKDKIGNLLNAFTPQLEVSFG